MPIVEAILRALLARYGAEILYRLLEQLVPQGTTPQDFHFGERLEAFAGFGGGEFRPLESIELEYDEDVDGFIWDQPCRGQARGEDVHHGAGGSF